MTLYTTTQAAKALGISPEYVRRLALDHNIGRHFGRDWAFTPADLETLRKIRQ